MAKTCKFCGQPTTKGWHRLNSAQPANGENVLLLMPESPSMIGVVIAYIYDTEWSGAAIPTRIETHPNDLWRHLPKRRHYHHSQDWSKPCTL